MAQFVMEGRDEAAWEESDFVLGYIEAMFFTSDEETEGKGYYDFGPGALDAIRKDCATWQEANADLLAKAYAAGYEEVQAGRDYWFTRNGHGVGFWDRKELEDGIGAALTKACAFSEEYVYVGDDGLVYVG